MAKKRRKQVLWELSLQDFINATRRRQNPDTVLLDEAVKLLPLRPWWEIQEAYYTRVYELTGGNKSKTARILKISLRACRYFFNEKFVEKE